MGHWGQGTRFRRGIRRWEGEPALAGEYLYEKASGAGLMVVVEYVFGTE